MQMRLLEKGKDSVRIEILNADDTVIYPLITALLKDPDVEDALYYTGHPQLDKPVLTVKVKKGSPQAALKRVAGDKVAARIKREPDPFIMGIVEGWPRNFEPKRALKLGFTTAEKSFDDIIRIHIEDELGGKFVA